MKDLGTISRYLGVEFICTFEGIFLHQHTYSKELLADFNMSNCKSTPIPLLEGYVASLDMGSSLVDRTHYYQVAGKLLYLTNTRPDLTLCWACYKVYVCSMLESPRCSQSHPQVSVQYSDFWYILQFWIQCRSSRLH